jgi:transcriptional regulator with XRE-family HTH domain
MKKKRKRRGSQPGRSAPVPRGFYQRSALILRQARKLRGLSQSDVAAIFHYHPQYVANWEAGVSLPPLDILKKLAAKLKLSIEVLLQIRVFELENKWRAELGLPLKDAGTK